jgi:ribosomal protein S18 acetylase RimI-like enzyme
MSTKFFSKSEVYVLKKIEKKEDFFDEDFNFSKRDIAEFLNEHLDKFGDPVEDIKKSIDYALSSSSAKGGFLLVLHDEDEILGSVIINNTGMNGYIPEHILVYIAVHSKLRGKGIGRKLIEETKKICDGNIALHVEYDNPAKKLYERSGFESKYAEMRFENE